MRATTTVPSREPARRFTGFRGALTARNVVVPRHLGRAGASPTAVAHFKLGPLAEACPTDTRSLAPAPPAPMARSRLAAPLQPRRPLLRPAAFSPEFRASPVYAPIPGDAVTDKYRGLSAEQLHQAFREEHPGLLEAIAASTAAIEPAAAAPLLRRLEAELPPALHDVGPTGDSVLVAIAPGLAPLLARAADCCASFLQQGDPQAAAATARAVLSLLSRLRFGSGPSAEPYSVVATRCKQALHAAYTAGAEVTEEDAAELESLCARASSWLWLTPYFGLRYAAAVEGFVAAGWRRTEDAVRYAEAYSRLLARGRYQLVGAKYAGVMRAAMAHSLSEDQAARLLAAERKLPPEVSIQLALDARGDPAADWLPQLEALHAERQRERLQHRSQQRALQKRGHGGAGPRAPGAQAQPQTALHGGTPAQHAQRTQRQRSSTTGVHACRGAPPPSHP